MTYTKVGTSTGVPDETVVQLDTGDLVAVRCPASRDTSSNYLVCQPCARAIDAAGQPVRDAAGIAITTAATLQFTAARVAELTADAIVRQCLLLVLGEPLARDENGLFHIGVSDALVEQQSIRNALATAQTQAPSAASVL